LIKKLRLSRSLRAQVLYVTLLGLAFGVLLFFALTKLGNAVIDERYMSSENINRRKAKIYAQFNAYVTSQGISGRDTAAVARWTATHDYVTIFLFSTAREQQLYSGGKLDPASTGGYDPMVHGKLFPIRFADGMYQVAIGDSSQVRQRQLVDITSFAAAAISFLLLFMWYTERLTRRIIALSREAAAVSEGDLERAITVSGDDEVSRLADSMDEMRRSVIERMGNEKRAWEANTELITAISHDIRTPMTSLIGYLGLLCEGNADEEARAQFASSAYGKAMELKDLTDQLFRYFLVYGKSELDLNRERFDARLLLQQMLGEMEFDLTDAGFTFRRTDFEGECSIETDALYLKRVMDNLVSNIRKYADPAKPVVISTELDDGCLILSISNAVQHILSRRESTKIGLRTCEKILEAMGGRFTVTNDEEHFTTELRLPTVES